MIARNTILWILGGLAAAALTAFIVIAYVGMNEAPSLESPWGLLTSSQSNAPPPDAEHRVE